MNNRVDINHLLSEMRQLKAQAQAFQPQKLEGVSDSLNPVKQVQQVPSFSEVLGQAIDKVNDTQQASSSLAKAYEQGDPSVDITDVMVASQKASVSFQAMVQVRNKLIDAYRDVMNMPI